MSVSKLFFSCLILCFLLFNVRAKFVFSQTAFSELEASETYSSELDIVNGSKWSFENKYKGNPYFYEDGLFEGSITFNGMNFSQLTLTYELLGDELILYKNIGNQTRELILNKNFVESFVLRNPGSANEYNFIRKKLPGVEGIKYYHAVYNGKTTCYIHHKKIINNRIKGNYLGEYLYQPVIYIEKENEYYGCKNKRSFLRLFDENGKQLRKFIRKNNLSIDGKKPGDIAKILEYYDTLAP